jgi:hypothetical protein
MEKKVLRPRKVKGERKKISGRKNERIREGIEMNGVEGTHVCRRLRLGANVQVGDYIEYTYRIDGIPTCVSAVKTGPDLRYFLRRSLACSTSVPVCF